MQRCNHCAKFGHEGMASLISAFAICLLKESIISKLASRGISIFWLIYIAEQTGLSLVFAELQMTGFVRSWPLFY